MNAWDLNLALESRSQERAVLKSGRRLFLLRPDAMIFCPLSMAGEDPSLQAVMLGPLDGGPEMIASPDPRSPKSRLEMFSRLLKVLEAYIRNSALDSSGLPQIIVPSSSAVALIEGLADWLPYLKDPGSSKMDRWAADARKLGGYLRLYSERSLLTGQQLILNASQMMDDHLAFGQDLKGHLGAQLIWADPPEGGDVYLEALKAMSLPMGVRSDARFDEEVLNPAIEGWLKVEKGGSRSLASFRRQEVEDALRQVLTPVYEAVGQSVRLLGEMGLETLPGLPELWARDRRIVEWHIEHMDEGGRFTRSDSATRAAYGLAESEDALEQWEAARLWGDPVYRAKSRSEGNTLIGKCEMSEEMGICRVLSQQKWLRIRVGDELTSFPDEVKATVVAMREHEGGKEISLLLSGYNQFEQNGQVLEWGKAKPDWWRLANHRSNLSRALATVPKTHQTEIEGETPTPPVWSDGDPDPLAMIEELR